MNQKRLSTGTILMDEPHSKGLKGVTEEIDALAKEAYEEYRVQLMSFSKSNPVTWDQLSPAAQLSFVASAKKLLRSYLALSDESVVVVMDELFPEAP